jgi:hypothetical protein
MPWIFASLISWLAEFFGKKALRIAFRLAVIAALVILILAAVNGFLSIINTSLTSISSTVPATISMLWSWLMPGNAKQCLVVVVAARIAKFYFTLSYKMLNTKAKAILDA